MKRNWVLASLLLSQLLFMVGLSVSDIHAQKPVDDAPLSVPTREPRLDIQIVGGQNADPGEYPWQVRVLPDPYLCGGSLIDDEWVLTAAHCVFDSSGSKISPASVEVYLGDHDQYDNYGTEQKRDIDEIVLPPPSQSYNPGTSDNDVALLHLSSPATLNDSVQPIALNQNSLTAGQLATVTGWGSLSSGGTSPDILQEVTVPIVSQQSCNASYSGGITNNMICAGYAQGGKDSCQGDSGGPLIVPNGSGGFKLAGVVSWGYGCALPGYPGVYAKVANYLDWIEAETGITPPTPTPTATPTDTPTATATPSVTPSVTATATPTNTQELIQDGGFELDQGAWTEYSKNGWPLIESGNITPNTGINYAWLGGDDDEYAKLSQGIDIPANSQLILEFYYQILSSDECGYDSAAILVNLAPVKQYDLCQTNATTGWVKETIDLTGTQGFVTLEFELSTDVSYASSLFLDDVSLKVVPDSSPTPTPTGTPTPGPLLNGEFEAGANGAWQESSTNDYDLILSDALINSIDAHGGSYLVWLAGANNETSTLTQTFTVPADKTTLQYYYQIDSGDSCGYDFANVLIDASSVLTQPYDLCGSQQTTGWQRATIDLSSFAGQEVTLGFTASTDSSQVSSFFVDTVSFIDAGSGPTPTPTPTGTPTPTAVPLSLTATANDRAINLSWSVTNDPSVTQYRLKRRPSGGSQISNPLVEIAKTSSTAYSDRDDDGGGNDLVSNEEYCYQVEALNSSDSAVAASNVTCVRFDQLTLALTIPNLTAIQGTQARVPVKLGGANDLKIGSSNIWIDYDATVVQALSVVTAPLAADYAWSYTDTLASGNIRRVKISYTSTNPSPISGDGVLLWLTFDVTGTIDAKTSLSIYRAQLADGTYGGTTVQHLDAQDGLRPVVLAPNSGSIQVASSSLPAAYVLGDVTGDGQIAAADVQEALAIATGKKQATGPQLAAGDISGDGAITAADASLISYYQANSGNWPSSTNTVLGSGQPITLSLDNISASAGQTVTATVRAAGLQHLAGADLTIIYDPAIVEAVQNVQTTGPASGFEVDFYDDGQGILRISMAGSSEISGQGDIVQIVLKLAGGLGGASTQAIINSRLNLAAAALNTRNGLDLVDNFPDDTFSLTLNSADFVFDTLTLEVYLPVVIRQ